MNYKIEDWSTKVLDPAFTALVNEMYLNKSNLDFNPPSVEEFQTFFNSERNYILWLYAKQQALVPGDFVEVGTYQGESAFYMAKECVTNMHVFDSWLGTRNMSDYDGEFYQTNTFEAPVTSAQKTLDGLNVNFHIGEVPFELDTLGDISLLHIDINLYYPTKTVLETLWDKVVPNGVVIVDFHDGVSSGAQKATIEFFMGSKDITMLPTGKAIIVK